MGEILDLEAGKQAAWSPLQSAPAGCLRWHRASFPAPVRSAAADFRINAAGLGKGMLFLNGHALGRYWLIAQKGPVSQPTQQFYHVPRTWLKDGDNVLLLFEETGASPAQVTLQRRIHA